MIKFVNCELYLQTLFEHLEFSEYSCTYTIKLHSQQLL